MPRVKITQDDIRNLTVGELELLEERTGRGLSRLFDADAPRGALLHTLAYIVLRRDDPSVTWEVAGDAIVELDDEAPGKITHTDPRAQEPAAGGRRTRRAG